MSRYIDLRLCDPKDSQAEFKITCALEDMVNGYMLPVYAAEIVDESIRADLEQCFELCKKIRNPTPQQLENGTVRRPNPDTLMSLVWMSVTLVSMRVPSNHPGQDRVVKFIQELWKLPRCKVPLMVGYSGEIEFGFLWTGDAFGRFKRWMWEVNRANFTLREQSEIDSETAHRHVNFSAFLARLFAAGIIETAEIGAVLRPSSFVTREPMPQVPLPESQTATQEYETWPSVAAQWLLHAGEGLFKLCAREAFLEPSKTQFSIDLWRSWKYKFETVLRSAEATADGREWATSALKQMQIIENRGLGTETVPVCEAPTMNYDVLAEKQPVELIMA